MEISCRGYWKRGLMANMRVHELAKELNISSKEVIDILSNDEKHIRL